MDDIGPFRGPSKVKLTLFSLYRRVRSANSGVPDALTTMVGADDVVPGEDGRPVVHAASVPFVDRGFDGLAPKAGTGLLALFGIRDTLEQLQHWRTVAQNSKAEFAYAEMWVDVGEVDTRLTTIESLRSPARKSRMVNLRRSTADFQRDLLARFQSFVRAEGGDAAQTMAEVRQMARRPDLFGRLMQEDADFASVDVLVIPLADAMGPISRIRQVAYVRAGVRVVEFQQGSDQCDVQLPVWMAKARRKATVASQERSALAV
jgi:hypothetical protein